VFYVADIRSRLRTLGWRWDELKTYWDVDQSEDLERYSGMTDIDNTQESATAYYGDIVFKKARD
jgi:hypothetical protein